LSNEKTFARQALNGGFIISVLQKVKF